MAIVPDKSLVIIAGVTKQIPDADTLNTGAGITSAAATTNLTITAATGVVAVASAATFSSTATVTGQTNTDGGIGRSTSGTLNIGNDTNSVAVNIATGANTTAVTLSRTGQTVTIAGNLQVNGTETVVGATVFDSTVTIGDGVGGPDTLDFNPTTGRLGSVANPDVKWLKETNHQFYVDDTTTAATAGGNLSIAAGLGTAAGGNLVLDAGSGTTGGTLSVGVTNSSAIAVGHSGVTTTVTGGLTQLTGAFSLTGNAASSATTTAGALTLSGFAGINLQGGGTSALVVNGAGTAITVQAGAVLATTGTGNINLPNNASARFQIEGVAVTANVTSANLATLTNGPASDASGLHTHSGLTASTVSIPANANQVTGTAVTAGQAIAATDPGVAGTWALADASNSAAVVSNFVGIAGTTVGAAAQLPVIVAGQVIIPDAFWDGGFPATTDVGSRVYESATTPGNVTLTAPSTSGQWAQRVGILTRGGTGVATLDIQPGEGFAL